MIVPFGGAGRSAEQAEQDPKWGSGDSNPDALRHMILSHARLPFPTLPQIRNRALMSTGFVKSSQLEEWIAAFIASRPSGTSPNTISFYHMTLNRLIGYSLSPDGINKFRADLPCGNGKRNYYVAIRAFCNWYPARSRYLHGWRW